MSNLDNEQNPINWLVGQPVHATEKGGEQYIPEQTLSEMIDTLLASANKDVPEVRQVVKRTAMEVVERSLYKTIGVSDLENRVFTAKRELSDFLNMAINGHQPVVAGGHTDLLPIGHPLSTNPAEVSLRTRSLSESEWVSADPRISEEFRPLVASIYLTSPGSVEHNFLVARLESADIKDVPKDVVLAVTAAGSPFGGGNSFLDRSARAKLQRRDRLGRFAFMGGGARAFIQLANGFIQSAVGRFVGVGTDSDTFDVEFIDDPVLGTGIYRMKTKNVAGVKAFIRNLRGMLKNVRPKSATYAREYAIPFNELQRLDAPNGWELDVAPLGSNDRHKKKFNAADGYALRQYDRVEDIPSFAENSKNRNVEVKGLGKKGEIDPNKPVYELYTDPANSKDKDKFDSDEQTLIGYFQSWGDIQSAAQRFDKKTYQAVDDRKEREMWGDAPDGDFPKGIFEQVNPSDDKTPFSTYRSKNNANGEGGYTVRRFQPSKHDSAKSDMDKNLDEGAEVRGFRSGSSEIEPDQPIFEVTRQPAPWEEGVEPDVIGYAQDWEDVQSMAEASEVAMPRGGSPRRKAVKKFKKDADLVDADEKDTVLPSDFKKGEDGKFYYTPENENAMRARITRDFRGAYVAEFYEDANDQKKAKPSHSITSTNLNDSLESASKFITEDNSTKSEPVKQEALPRKVANVPATDTEQLPREGEIFPVPDVSNVIGADGKQIDPALLEWYADANGIRIPDANLKDSDKTPENRRVRDLENNRVLDGNGREVDFDPKYSPDADPRPDIHPSHEDGFWDSNEVNNDEVQKGITDPQLAYEALYDGGFIEVSQEVALEAVLVAMEDRKFIGPDDNAIGPSRLARAASSALQGLPTAQANRLRRAINPAALNEERAKELMDFVSSKNGEPLTREEMDMLHRKYRNMGVDITNMKMIGTSNYLNNNLGAERGKMPQLSTPEDQEDFEAALTKLGIKFEPRVFTPDELTPVQAEMDMGNVGLIMGSWLDPALRAKFKMDEQVLYVTRDGYVIDGHHRWASALLAQQKSGIPVELKCVVVDLDHEEALRICNEYNDHIGVTRQTLGATSPDAKATPKRDIDGEVGRNAVKPSVPVEAPLQEPPEEIPDGETIARLPEGAPAPQSPSALDLVDTELPATNATTRGRRGRIKSGRSVRDFLSRKGTNRNDYRTFGEGFVFTDDELGVGLVPTPEKQKEFDDWLKTHEAADQEVRRRISARMAEKYGPRWAELFLEASAALNDKNVGIGELKMWALDVWDAETDQWVVDLKNKVRQRVRRDAQAGKFVVKGDTPKAREQYIQQITDYELLETFKTEFYNIAKTVEKIEKHYKGSEIEKVLDRAMEAQKKSKKLKTRQDFMNRDLSIASREEYRKYLEEVGVEMYDGDGSELFEFSTDLTDIDIETGAKISSSQREDSEKRKQIEDAMREALRNKPKWMVDKLLEAVRNTSNGKIKVELDYSVEDEPRGWFNVIDGNLYIRVSPNNQPHGLLEYGQTASHEITHAFEAAIPELREYQWSFMSGRTRTYVEGTGPTTFLKPLPKAEPISKFESVVANQPENPERGILDDFRHTYASRMYNPLNPLNHYELASMAQERMMGGGTFVINNPNVIESVRSGQRSAEDAIFDTDTTLVLGFMIDGQDSELELADAQIQRLAILRESGWAQSSSANLVDVGMIDETQNLASQAETQKSAKSLEVISRIADVGDKRVVVNEDYGDVKHTYQRGRYITPDGQELTMYFVEAQIPNGDGTYKVQGSVEITDGYDEIGSISFSEVGKVLGMYGEEIWDETKVPLWYSRDLYDVTKPFSTIGFVEVVPEQTRKGIATALLEFARRHSENPIHHSHELLEDGKHFAKAVQTNISLIEDLPVSEGDAPVSLSDLYGAQSEKAKQIESRIVSSGQEPVVKTTKLPSFINNVDHTMVETTTDSVYTTESGEKFTLRRKVEEVRNDSTGQVIQLRGTVFAFPEGQDIPDDIDEDTDFAAEIDYVGGKKDISAVAEEYKSTVDDSKPFATIYGILTKPENQRKGLATALLLVARKDSAMPVYHSSLRTMDGYRFSQAIQNSNDVIAEDLPVEEENRFDRDDIGGKFSSDSFKAIEIRSRMTIDEDKTKVEEINRNYKESKSEGTYELYDGRKVKLVFTEQIERMPFDNGIVVEGAVEAVDELGNEVGSMSYTTAERFNDGTYDLDEIANELHPDADNTKPFTAIQLINVEDDYQNNGVASAILEFARIHTVQPLYHSSNRSDDGRGFSRKIGSPSVVEEELPDVKETPKTREIASRVKSNDDLEKTETDRGNGEKEFGVTRTAKYTDEDGVVYNLEFTLGGIVDEEGKTVGSYRSGSVRAYTKGKNNEYMDNAGSLEWKIASNLNMIAQEAQSDVDLTKPFNYVRSVMVYPDYTRKGLATAMLQFARSQDEQPIYHSSIRTNDGLQWSTKVQSSGAVVEEDLPVELANKVQAEGTQKGEFSGDSEQAEKVISRLTVDKDKTKLIKFDDDDKYTELEIEGSYKLYDGREVIIRGREIRRVTEDGNIAVEGILYPVDKTTGFDVGAFLYGTPKKRDQYDWEKQRVVKVYPLSTVAEDLHPDVDQSMPFAVIDGIQVYDEWRKNGVASALLEMARLNAVQPIYHSALRSDDGIGFSRKIGAPPSVGEDLPEASNYADPKDLTDRDINHLLETSPVTKDTLKFQSGNDKIGSLATRGYKESALAGYKPNFDADGDNVRKQIYDRAIDSGFSDKEADELATKQTVQVKDFIQRKNDKSRLAYQVEKAITPPEGASEKVVNERSRWAKTWDKNTTTVKERISRALAVGRIVEPVDKDKFLNIAKGEDKFTGVGFVADDFSSNISLPDRESESPKDINSVMRNILNVRNKKHDSKVKVVFKDSVRDNTKYTIGDPSNSGAIAQPLDSGDEDAMVMAGLMGNANGAFISMSGIGAPKDETAQVETRTTGELGLADVEAVYVSGEDTVNEISNALSGDFPNIDVVDVDSIEASVKNIGRKIESTPSELAEDLPTPDRGTGRVISEKAKAVRENLSIDEEPVVTYVEKPSYGGTREYINARGSYRTPNGELLDFFYKQERGTDDDGTRWTDGAEITVFDDDYNLIGRLEVHIVDTTYDKDGNKGYSLLEIDMVSHPELVGLPISEVPIADISWIKVEDDYQRQGIGTAMLEFARQIYPDPIYHSSNLSPAGRKYATAVANPEIVEEDLPEPSDVKPLPPLVEDEPPKPEATAEAIDNARIVRERALEVEPQITADVSSIAKSSGGVLKSLEHRIKTTKSLARKIDKDAVDDFDGDRSEAALRMSDAVRYTMVTSTGDYVGAIKQAREEFLALGYQVQNEKNFWKSDEYKGYTFKLVSPEGYAVEFQIHTDESYEIKDDLHTLYEELRAIPPGTNIPRARQLSVELKRLASLIPVPEDEELFEIGKLVQYTPDKELTRLGKEFEDVLPVSKSQPIQSPTLTEEELPTYKYEPVSSKSKFMAERIVEDPSKTKIEPDVEKLIFDVDGASHWLALHTGHLMGFSSYSTYEEADFDRLDEYRINPPELEITVSTREHVATYIPTRPGSNGINDSYELKMEVKEVKDSKTGKVIRISGTVKASPERDTSIEDEGGEFLFSSPRIVGIDEQGNFLYDSRMVADEVEQNLTRDDLKKAFGFVTGVYVDEDVQRQGIATAMLEFARQKAGLPIYHSSNRTDEGFYFSTAVQSPTVTEEELPDVQGSSGIEYDLWGDPILSNIEGAYYDPTTGAYRYNPKGAKAKEVAKRITPTNEGSYDDSYGNIYYYADYVSEDGVEYELVNKVNELPLDEETDFDSERLAGHILVYTKDGRVVGDIDYYGAYKVGESYDDSGLPHWYSQNDYDTSKPFAVINIARVDGQHRRRGLATAMLEFARSNAGMPIHHSSNLSDDGRNFARKTFSPPSLTVEEFDLPLKNVEDPKEAKIKSIVDRITYGPKYDDSVTSQQSGTYTSEDGTVFRLEYDTYAPLNIDTGVRSVAGQVQSMVDGSFAGHLTWESADYDTVGDDEVVWKPVSEVSEVAEETENIDTSKSFSIIRGLAVSDSQRRRGLATAMLHFARQASSEPIYHSQQRTDDGKAFSRAVQSPDVVDEELPETSAQSTSSSTITERAKFGTDSLLEAIQKIEDEDLLKEQQVDAVIAALKSQGISERDIAESTYGKNGLLPYEGEKSVKDIEVLDTINGQVISLKKYLEYSAASANAPEQSNYLYKGKVRWLLDTRDYKNYKEYTFEDAKKVLKSTGGYDSNRSRYVLLGDAEVSVPLIAKRKVKTFIDQMGRKQRTPRILEGKEPKALTSEQRRMTLDRVSELERRRDRDSKISNTKSGKVSTVQRTEEDLPDSVPASIVSDRDKNIQEAIDDKGILTLRAVRDSAREDFIGFNHIAPNISTITLGLGQSQDRSDEFMRRLWDLNSKYLDESLAVVEWKVFTQTKEKMLAAGLSDRAATRAAEGAYLAAVAYAKLKNHATAMKEIASVMADEFPEDKWFGGYYKRAMVTREEVKKVLIDGVPVIAADFDAALGIIGDKRFKTQWETKTSNGLYQPSTREKREYGLLAVDPKTPKSKRPIYGFLANKDSGTSPMTKPYNSDVFSANSRGASQYGDVRFVLKPETRDRTTFTMLDSLDVRSLPQPLSDNPTDEQLDMAGFWQNVADSHDGFIRENYVETQVLGGVSIDDVQKIVVAVPDYLGVAEIEEKVNALRAALDAGGYSNIEVVPLAETVSEDYDDSLNTSGIPL